MTTQVQKRRGTTSEHSTFTGAEGEITVDTTKDTAVVHDGVSAGGKPLAREDLNNVSASTVAAKLNGTALTGVDINSGSIDSTTIGATTPAAGTFTALTATGTTTLAGATTSADINFGDNDKAIFGAGSDLQIYHSGSNSFIKDVGQGNLLLDTNGSLAGFTSDGVSKYMALFNKDASVDLYYNNSKKLATTSTGIDVTGEITADGIALGDSQKATFGASDDLQIYHDGSHSYVRDNGTGALKIMSNGDAIHLYDTANSQYMAYFNTGGAAILTHAGDTKFTTTSTGIDVTGTATMDGLTSTGDVLINGGTNTLDLFNGSGQYALNRTSTNMRLSSGGAVAIATGYPTRNYSAYFANSGDISFYEDTGTTAKFFWDASAESLGIGTSTPAVALDVYPTVSSNTSALRGNNQLGSSGAYTTTVQSTNNWNYAPFVVERLASNTGTPRMISMQLDGDDPASTTIGGYNAIWGAYDSAPTTGSTSSALNGAMVYGAYSGHRWYNNGSERMRITSSGNVGIGTDSPQNALHIAATDATLRLQTTSDTGEAGIEFWDNQSGTSQAGAIRYDDTINLFTIQGNSNGTIFKTPSNTFPSSSEAMRIDSSGNLLVGKTSSGTGNAGFQVVNNVTGVTGASTWALIVNRTGTDGQSVLFQNDTVSCGSISVSGSSTAYNTSSDYRLKEDWQPVANASDRVAQLKPVNFAWKADGTRVDGFLAHELQEVIPEAVTGEKDAMRTEEYVVTEAIPATYDEEGNELTPAVDAVMGTREVPDYQGIDQSKLVPLLTAALQEALTEIDNLKQRVSALETS